MSSDFLANFIRWNNLTIYDQTAVFALEFPLLDAIINPFPAVTLFVLTQSQLPENALIDWFTV